MNRKTEHEQAERNDQRHDRRLGDDAGEIADQQMGHRVERPGDVGLVLFREHDDDHIRKQVTFFQEEKGNERNGESRDHRIADRRNDRREQVIDHADVEQRLDLFGNRIDQRELALADRENAPDETLERHQRLLERLDDLRNVERGELADFLENDRHEKPEDSHDDDPDREQRAQGGQRAREPRPPDMQPRKQVGQRLADNRQNGRHQNIGDHVAEIPHQKENHCRDSACNEISV